MQLKGLLAVTVALIVAGPVQASLNAAAADKSPVQDYSLAGSRASMDALIACSDAIS